MSWSNALKTYILSAITTSSGISSNSLRLTLLKRIGDSALLNCSWPSVIMIPAAAMDTPSLKTVKERALDYKPSVMHIDSHSLSTAQKKTLNVTGYRQTSTSKRTTVQGKSGRKYIFKVIEKLKCPNTFLPNAFWKKVWLETSASVPGTLILNQAATSLKPWKRRGIGGSFGKTSTGRKDWFYLSRHSARSRLD